MPVFCVLEILFFSVYPSCKLSVFYQLFSRAAQQQDAGQCGWAYLELNIHLCSGSTPVFFIRIQPLSSAWCNLLTEGRMSCKGFQESRPRFSNLLTGQCWIFLKNGLEDFRNGFPPSPDNMLVNGRKQPVSIILENSTPKSLPRAPWKKRNQCSRAQVCLSKLSLLQQARKDYVAQIECCLSQHPSVCYPCLEKSTSPKVIIL